MNRKKVVPIVCWFCCAHATWIASLARKTRRNDSSNPNFNHAAMNLLRVSSGSFWNCWSRLARFLLKVYVKYYDEIDVAVARLAIEISRLTKFNQATAISTGKRTQGESLVIEQARNSLSLHTVFAGNIAHNFHHEALEKKTFVVTKKSYEEGRCPSRDRFFLDGFRRRTKCSQDDH